MTSVVVIDGGGNVLEYVTGDEEAQQVRNVFVLYIFPRTYNTLPSTKGLFMLPFCMKINPSITNDVTVTAHIRPYVLYVSLDVQTICPQYVQLRDKFF